MIFSTHMTPANSAETACNINGVAVGILFTVPNNLGTVVNSWINAANPLVATGPVTAASTDFGPNTTNTWAVLVDAVRKAGGGFQITGVTRDNTGNLVGSVDVFLLKYNSGTHLFTQIAHGISDSGTGVFTFSGLADNAASYNVVAFKDGSPHVFDVSDRNIQPV